MIHKVPRSCGKPCLVLKVEHKASPAFAVIRVGDNNGGTIGLLPLQKVSLNPILAAIVRLAVWAGLAG
jgi:hypothetical protein